jgi:predicted PurR-regulated permease PerM
MSDEQETFLRFGVADILAATAAAGLWIILYPQIRRLQPLIDPIFLAVMLTCLFSSALAAFVGRRHSSTIVVGCSLLTAFCATALVRICFADLQ